MVVKKIKEKCKDAARMRREKERTEFFELSKLLPLPSSTTSQLDKASIIRLTSSYLRMRSAFPWGLGDDWGTKKSRAGCCSARHSSATSHYNGSSKESIDRPRHVSIATSTGVRQPPEQGGSRYTQQSHVQMKELGSLILQTLDGFVFALHRDGKIMYISETASVQLGLSQIDLTGSSIFEYVHPADHNDIYKLLSINDDDKSKLELETNDYCELGRSFCMRMKCILPKRNAGLVTSGYKAIHCNGYLKVRYHSAPAYDIKANQFSTGQASISSTNEHNNQQRNVANWESYALVAVGHSLLPTATTEYKMSTNSFMFRANLDFQLYYIESQSTFTLGYEQTDMVDQSLYQFVHLNDIKCLEQGHRTLLDKGQVISKYFRIMKQDGGFVWVQTYAILVNNPRSVPKPQHIVGVFCIIGEDPHDTSCLLYNEKQSKVPSSSSKEVDSISNLDSTLRLDRKRKDQSLVNFDSKRNQKRCKTGSYAVHDGDKVINNVENLYVEKFENSSTYNDWTRHNLVVSEDANLKMQEMNRVKEDESSYITIGSTRRASDDSCSVVSSVASTSFSSISPSIEKSTFSQQSISTTDTLYLNELDGNIAIPIVNQVIPGSFQPSSTNEAANNTFIQRDQINNYPTQMSSHMAEIQQSHTSWDCYQDPHTLNGISTDGQTVVNSCNKIDTKMSYHSKLNFIDMSSANNNVWVYEDNCQQTLQYDVLCCGSSINGGHMVSADHQVSNLDHMRAGLNHDGEYSINQPVITDLHCIH